MLNRLLKGFLLAWWCLACLPAVAETALFIHSQSGHAVASGRTLMIRQADGFAFTVFRNTYWGSISVQASGDGSNPALGSSWNLYVAGANNTMPTVGMYDGAMDMLRLGSSYPVLTFWGDGYGDTGSFRVIELDTDVDGNITRLALDFIVAGPLPTSARLFGQLRFNSDVPIDTVIRVPNPYRFTDALGTPPGQTVTANMIDIAGLSVPVPISITNGEYRIDNGPYTSAAGMVQSGQSVQVRAQAPGIANAVTVARLTVGTYYDDFSVGTPPGSFPQPHGEPLIVRYFSNRDNIVPIEQIASPAAGVDITASGGGLLGIHAVPHGATWPTSDYRFRGAGNPSPPIVAGDYSPLTSYAPNTALPVFEAVLNSCTFGMLPSSSMRVHEAEYASDGTPLKFAADVRVRCGAPYGRGTNEDFFFRLGSTVPIDYNLSWPLPFDFETVTNAIPGAPVLSEELAVGGINVTLPISVTGGEYSIDGGQFTAMPGTVTNGRQIRLRTLAPAAVNDIRSMTLTVGARSGTFAVASRTGVPQPNGRPLVAVYDQYQIEGGFPTVYSDATLLQVRLAAASNPAGTVVELFDPDLNGGNLAGSLRLVLNNQPRLVAGTFSLEGANPAASLQGTGPLTIKSAIWSYGLCDAGDGSLLRIIEAGYAPDGSPLTLAADIVLRCSNSTTTHYLYIRVGSAIPIDYRVTRPIPFGFNPAVNVLPGTMATSEEAVVARINAPASISVDNGAYSIDGGPFTSAPGLVNNQQRIRLRGLAPASASQYAIVRVNVGGQAANFRIGTATGLRPQPSSEPLVVLIKKSQMTSDAGTTVLAPANGQDFFLTNPYPDLPDSTGIVRLVAGLRLPDYKQENRFAFTLSTPPAVKVMPGFYPGLYLDTASFSSTISVCFTYDAGPRAESSVRVHEITYDAGGNPTSLAMDFVVWCQGMSDAIYGYVRINSTVPINYTVADTFPLYLGAAGGVVPGTMVISNTQTVTGINVPVPVSISNGEYRIGDGDWTSAPGVIANGNLITVRTRAPDLENRLTTAELTVYNRVARFTVGTRTGPNPQPTAGVNVIVTISQPGDPAGNGYNRIFSSALRDSITATGNTSSVQVLTTPYTNNNGNFNAYIWQTPNAPLQAGEYTFVAGSNSYPRFQYGNCYAYQASGTLRVHEIEYGTNGTLSRLALDFVQTCNGAAEPMHGYVRINSTVPIQQIVDDLPNPLDFYPLYYVAAASQITSYSQFIGNANVTMPVAVAGGEYQIDDGAFTSQPGIISPGQYLRLRQLSSAIPGRTASMTVNVGRASATYSVTTTPNAVPPDGLPGAPTGIGGAAGDGSVTLHFRPPRITGGAGPLDYLVSCNGDSGVVAGTSSPVTRTGLVNGQVYSCVVIARNANGLGGASNSFSLTPSANAPLIKVGVVSRKNHGSAGAFDLPLDSWYNINYYLTVEPRAASGGHELVFFFNRPITATGAVTVSDQNMADLGNAIATASGNSVVVKLPAIADGKRATVTLAGTNGSTDSFSIALGFLLGDINGSRTISVVDILAGKRRIGQPLAHFNFLSDIDLSGEIDTLDLALVKARSGSYLP